MPKMLREKNKVKCTAVAVVADEGELLESVIKANISLSLMVRSEDTCPSPSFEEDATEELFTLNIQVKNEVIDAISILVAKII